MSRLAWVSIVLLDAAFPDPGKAGALLHNNENYTQLLKLNEIELQEVIWNRSSRVPGKEL